MMAQGLIMLSPPPSDDGSGINNVVSSPSDDGSGINNVVSSPSDDGSDDDYSPATAVDCSGSGSWNTITTYHGCAAWFLSGATNGRK